MSAARDFGLTWNQALETGGVVVGKKLTIEIEAEAVHEQAGVEHHRGGAPGRRRRADEVG